MRFLYLLLRKGFENRFIVEIRVGDIVVETHFVLLMQVSEVNLFVIVVTIGPRGVLIQLTPA